MLKSDIVDGFHQSKTQKLQKVITFDPKVTGTKYYIHILNQNNETFKSTPGVKRERSRDLSRSKSWSRSDLFEQVQKHSLFRTILATRYQKFREIEPKATHP